MPSPLLTLQNVSLGFGGEPLFDGLDLQVGAGDRICLVGRNGSGKSTLLKLIAGQVEPDAGERIAQPGIRIAYLPQEPDFAGFTSVAAYVGAAPAGAEEVPWHRVAAMLDAVGLAGDADPAILSGGEARRAALARCLVGDPDILLLDEPTNHLDLPTIEWLEAELQRAGRTFVLVSHDRTLLHHVTGTIFWLDRGMVRRLDQGFAGFEAWSEEILEREARERDKLDKRIAQETAWSRAGISARRRRNQGRLRRLDALRAERARRVGRTGSVKLEADIGGLSGRLVVEAEGIAKSYGGRPVVRDFSTRILRGDRVGIIGPNGAGKTTLLRMLTGDLEPDAGMVRLGTNLTMAYIDQRRAALDPAASVRDILCEGGGDQVMVRGRPRHVTAYLRDFLFEERQVLSPVGSLSGGERNRLLLAKVLAQLSNFLVLDEPTNDLDMDTLDLLQELLADYDGTLLLVSHDRDFLDRVVTSTIALEGDGRAGEYPGGYSDYLRQRPVREPRQSSATKRREASDRERRPATRLSYKQQRALEELPQRIAALEQEIDALQAQLADPGLYARDADVFRTAADRLEQATQELGRCEEAWLEIALLREELAERGNG